MRLSVFFVAVCVVLSSCSPAKRLGLQNSFEAIEQEFQDHTGFMLYDLESKKTIFEFNSARYFTPASNTKIFTFYTSLRIIGDSVPAFKYIVRNDSLIFWGTGDPSFLYKNTFDNARVYNFLAGRAESLYFSTSNFHTTHFGSGWAWDDYNDAYSSERSPFPLYGNLFTITRTGQRFVTQPRYFAQHFSIGERKIKEEMRREVSSNNVKYHPGTGRPKNPPEWNVPMRVEVSLMTELLTDTLGKAVRNVKMQAPPTAVPFYSIPADSLYSVMMQDSDNFIAEQLLLICSDIVRDSMKTEIAIRYSIKNFLDDLPDKPVWVDGSGLSRYNLFTPRSIVKLWEKIYELVPRDRLFPLLATGGKNGTIKNWYKADPPYIFGKTGSLSNNHTLSGYLVTKSGKTLIFSFMNNNFVASQRDMRLKMEKILNNIYLNY